MKPKYVLDIMKYEGRSAYVIKKRFFFFWYRIMERYINKDRAEKRLAELFKG